MEMVLIKEKLIEIVRKYECIYNTKHREYKNKNYKVLSWERIGSTLEIEGNKAKEIWRTLRDGYMRYKRQIAGKTGSGRKYYKYIWSAQMAFLDGTLELRPTSTNITAPQEPGCDSPESRISQQVSSLPPLSPQPGPSYADTSQSPGTPNTASSIQLLISDSILTNEQSLPHTAERSVKNKKKQNNLSSEARTDKVLEYLKKINKQKHQLDDVDHLFASYAKSFKKLSRRTQAELKINLAKLFADAEISEISELGSDTNINKSPQSQLIYLSSTYSDFSDESTQPILLAEEMLNLQTHQPLIDLTQQEQDKPEDLSRSTQESGESY